MHVITTTLFGVAFATLLAWGLLSVLGRRTDLAPRDARGGDSDLSTASSILQKSRHGTPVRLFREAFVIGIVVVALSVFEIGPAGALIAAAGATGLWIVLTRRKDPGSEDALELTRLYNPPDTYMQTRFAGLLTVLEYVLVGSFIAAVLSIIVIGLWRQG